MVKSEARKETEQRFVTDTYFSKDHWLQKIWQTLWAIIGWVCVIVPVYWTLSATIFSNSRSFTHMWKYTEGKALFYFFDRFFLVAFIIFAILTVAFTIHNNHFMKRHVKQQTQYDHERVLERRAALELFYTERFGAAEVREQVRYYSVKPEQNFDKDTIKQVYAGKDVNSCR